MSDPINPDHYQKHPSGVQCIEITEHFDFIIGNIIKYAWRAGLKEGASKMEDLEKCLWYANRAVDREHLNQPAKMVVTDTDGRTHSAINGHSAL